MSKSAKPRSRQQLSRAELKAYEARRAAEIQRSTIAPGATHGSTASNPSQVRRPHLLSRAEEVEIIRSDLKRLLIILAVLVVVLVAATIVLR